MELRKLEKHHRSRRREEPPLSTEIIPHQNPLRKYKVHRSCYNVFKMWHRKRQRRLQRVQIRCIHLFHYNKDSQDYYWRQQSPLNLSCRLSLRPIPPSVSTSPKPIASPRPKVPVAEKSPAAKQTKPTSIEPTFTRPPPRYRLKLTDGFN